jgi:hypothetical protein
VLAVLAALVAIPLFYRDVVYRVDEEIRARVEAKIAERFPHLEVHVRSAQLVADGIEARGVSILEPGAAGPQAELALFEEVFLACSASLQELIRGDLEITSIKLSRPIVRATRRPDGSYSLSKLLPLKQTKELAAVVTVENGTIQIFDPLKNPSTSYTLRDIHLEFKRLTPNPSGHVALEFEGSLAADQIQRVELVGSLDATSGHWALHGSVDGCDISPEIRNSLPEQISKPLEMLSSLKARADFSFRLSREDAEQPPKFEINGTLGGGRIDDPLLPWRLSDLKANFHGDNAGLKISDLSARDGPMTWEVSELTLAGFTRASPLFVHVIGKQVRLDHKLGDALPDPWRVDWHNYSPEGEADLECTLRFDGKRWTPKLEVTLLNNVSFSCHKFPYRLEGARGKLTVNGNVADVNLVAFSGARPVTLKGRFLDPGPQFTGSIDIRAQQIQFDEKLFRALKPKAQETVRALNPRETFDIHAVLWRDKNDPLPRPDMHQRAEITLNHCSMKYLKFPYPLHNLQGTLFVQDGQWTFDQVEATCDTGVVQCTFGRLNTSPVEDRLELELHARNLPLEKKLHDALNLSQQQLWDSLQPRGGVDVDVRVDHNSRTKVMSVGLRAEFRDDSTSTGTSIEPKSFPYRMEKLRGTISYRDGHVELKNLQADHRNTHMSTGGSCDFFPDGSWKLSLRKFWVNRLHLHGEGADQELVTSLPEGLKHAVAELRPTGSINLTGNRLDFSKARHDARLETAWDVKLSLEQVSLQVGPKLENISGGVQLVGSSDGVRYASRGELNLDSVMYKNFQFSQILGPLYFDNDNANLGDWRAGGGNRRVTAKLLGGTVAGECQIRLGNLRPNELRYGLSASISQADLGMFARENLANHQKLNGKLVGDIKLVGNREPHTMFGSGNLHLSDADVYKLPVMVALLKIVRAKPPDTTAFTQSDIRFEVRGQHIHLAPIEFRGDAVNLSGQGDITLDGQTNPINLDFHTMVGRGNIPLLTGLLSEASQQILTIHVGGTLDNPVTRTDVLPAANQAIQQLQADYDRPTALPPTGALRRNLSPAR